MILAIDVGNSETDFGLWDGAAWVGMWRLATAGLSGVEIGSRAKLEDIGVYPEGATSIFASVVPRVNPIIRQAALTLTGRQPFELTCNLPVGMEICYDPPGSTGQDRIANALGALARFEPPIIVVDFGTATTFDVVNARGAFIGGAIMPGLIAGATGLESMTAQLPKVSLETPPHAIARNTVQGLQSGLVLGHAAAVEGLLAQISAELESQPTVVATGGLGERFMPLCPTISEYIPTLTLDGLVEAAGRFARSDAN